MATRCCTEPLSRHAYSYAIAAGEKDGVVVTPNGCHMAVYHTMMSVLYACIAWGADGTATLLHIVGCHGAWLKQFKHALKMRSTFAGSLRLLMPCVTMAMAVTVCKS